MIAATLSGPSYAWRPNHDEASIEVFATLEDAVVALIERHHAGSRTCMSYQNLDGNTCIAQFPDFGEGMMFTCYSVAGALDGKPTEEQITDALVDVHSLVWTWKLTLTRTNEATGRVSVIVEGNR